MDGADAMSRHGTDTIMDPMMASLAKPRKSFNKSRNQTGATTLKAADGTPVSPGAYELLRMSDASELKRATKAELEDVRSLNHVVNDTGAPFDGGKRIADMEARRSVTITEIEALTSATTAGCLGRLEAHDAFSCPPSLQKSTP